MKKYLYLGLIVLAVVMVYGTYDYYTVTSDTIVVGYLPSNHHSALFVANAKGMYEKEGFKVQMVPFKNGADMIDAANKNQLDVGFCGITPITSSIDKNSTIKIVAPANEDGSGIVVQNGSNITNLKDLEGKTILEPGSGSIQDVLLRYMLMKNNVSTSNINISQFEVPLMQEALTDNRASAFIAWEPYVTQANLTGEDDVFIYSSDIWDDHPCCVIFATQNMMTKKPDQLRKFLKAHTEATDYINGNLNETSIIVSNKLGTNPNIELASLEHVKFISEPNTEYDNNLMKLVSLQQQLGYVKNNLTLSQIVNYNFLPN
ncbi:ABC-type transporter, periplasmic subunit family 3 [Methanobacterium lacus]|uniref:ABC-type transporter, periplasmic subunit family 3 n=1 Tax=Methanobacterium lacus (strain AL-21) TaxID=877455 RepID=F0TAN7_METLA|nr:ABC transporter substrate-binding protein [Methanobacterium lacus]ADZ10109.1 ABC-type transporter, periplasmic subunit family 3 [Methanobacterium lacus]